MQDYCNTCSVRFQSEINALEILKRIVEKRPYCSDEVYGLNLQINEYKAALKNANRYCDICTLYSLENIDYIYDCIDDCMVCGAYGVCTGNPGY